MAASVALPTPAPAPIDSKHMATTTTTRTMGREHECPKCGTSLDGSVKEVPNAQKRIEELEAQVQMLTMKATAAVDKCADYEDQLRGMRPTTAGGLPRSNTMDTLAPAERGSNEEPRPSTANSTSAKASRFSFLRRGSPAQSQPPAPPPPALPPSPESTQLLEQQLVQERALRAKAEERARKVDGEIEELSVQLFSEANEMVAEERRARKRLEERVEMLEKKDRDKMARLERLEKAVMRIDRVKALLGTPGPAVNAGSGGLAVPVTGGARKY
ncbi:hypothetical protein P154DRAFT_519520 [Amniculicola lignicola CBS 123094]|uniref:GDP/GTP exchange factor Sec2 N-terminal domain-containing protein n=1 Tax=Amniculicola lignicola CBS 123094 TaxID=1392246 RepID=A0A6A5WRY3_9PLEO|nr:hypothetical protein P154DRAFT_519520 [Amniculicola lignicola CBS 123094]